MIDLMDDEARAVRDRAEQLRAKQLRQQVRADVQALFASVEARRVVHGFLQLSGVDASAYRDNPTAMAHAAGWRDAGNYWLDLIRSHCPEREAQMRAEARKDAKQNEVQDDDE